MRLVQHNAFKIHQRHFSINAVFLARLFGWGETELVRMSTAKPQLLWRYFPLQQFSIGLARIRLEARLEARLEKTFSDNIFPIFQRFAYFLMFFCPRTSLHTW